jgi:4-alpha-glucanotransferase
MSERKLFDWLDERGAGVLLHPTSFPGDQGIGTLGPEAIDFLDFLAAAGMSYWQVCPLGPTGYGDSPYQCFSAFAGNPYLIDLRDFVARGFLRGEELAPLQKLPRDKVDFGWLWSEKWKLLEKAHERFVAGGRPDWEGSGFAQFVKQQASWLEPYALFMALKNHNEGKAWTHWPLEQRTYAGVAAQPLLLKALAAAADAHRFYQWVFFAQWAKVKAAAKKRGIAIIGDLPIFVSADSADVWARPELFDLNPTTGQPVNVAGVPPDYFSADGQLWGNPLYRWAEHERTRYAWWRDRLSASFAVCDVLRIDHFRGFDQYWQIPGTAPTARTGKWVAGPGLGFFEAIREAFPEAKIIAEDLGILTPSVVKLRDETGLPGMAVLQFAFGGNAENLYLPHNGVANCVVYAGTHDNDTTHGWYAAADAQTADHVRRYLRVSGQEIAWDLIRAAYGSVPRLAIVTLQDLLKLGSEGRFNTPGKPAGNWGWRYSSEQLARLSQSSAGYLKDLGELFGRYVP